MPSIASPPLPKEVSDVHKLNAVFIEYIVNKDPPLLCRLKEQLTELDESLKHHDSIIQTSALYALTVLQMKEMDNSAISDVMKVS